MKNCQSSSLGAPSVRKVPQSGSCKRTYIIHEHIHRRMDMDFWPLLYNRDRVLNAGVAINSFQPVTFEELLGNDRSWKDRMEKA